MTGTIHHLICPNCGNQTVDPQDGECKYAYCDEQRLDDEIANGCPHCGSYEGDYQECPECGHGQ